MPSTPSSPQRPSGASPPAGGRQPSRRAGRSTGADAVAAARRSGRAATALWVGVPALVGVSIVTASVLSARSAGDDLAALDADVVTYTDLPRGHTTSPVSYPQSPPVGGNHDPAWAGCDGTVYPAPVRNETAVHSLEHGAVWITVQPQLPADQRGVLVGKVSGAPYTMLSPLPGQVAPITLTAWGAQLTVPDAADPRIDRFLTTYRQGPQTPEPGASCTAPPGTG